MQNMIIYYIVPNNFSHIIKFINLFYNLFNIIELKNIKLTSTHHYRTNYLVIINLPLLY